MGLKQLIEAGAARLWAALLIAGLSSATDAFAITCSLVNLSAKSSFTSGENIALQFNVTNDTGRTLYPYWEGLKDGIDDTPIGTQAGCNGSYYTSSFSCTIQAPPTGRYERWITWRECPTCRAYCTTNPVVTLNVGITPPTSPTSCTSTISAPSSVAVGAQYSFSASLSTTGLVPHWEGTNPAGHPAGETVSERAGCGNTTPATWPLQSFSCNYSVDYAGSFTRKLVWRDPNYPYTARCTSNQITITGATAGTSCSLNLSPTSIYAGQSYTATANVSQVGLTPYWEGSNTINGVTTPIREQAGCNGAYPYSSFSCSYPVPQAGSYTRKLVWQSGTTRVCETNIVTLTANPAPANQNCSIGNTGYHNSVGIPSGDLRFLCMNNQWYACNWETSGYWAQNVSAGATVGNWSCNPSDGNWVSTENCAGQGTPYTGVHNQTYLSNGDTRFKCHRSRWYDCGWEGDQPAWETKIADGGVVGEHLCRTNASAYGGSWIKREALGNIDGFVPLPDGSMQLHGWACDRGYDHSIDVEVYVGGAKGVGVYAGTAAANVASESGVASACNGVGSAYRFSIPLLPEMISRPGQAVYVHGVSKVGNPTVSLAKSGSFLIPRRSAGALLASYVSKTSLSPSESFVMRCDYGYANTCTAATVGTQTCVYSPTNTVGTAYGFTCTAPATAGTHSVGCKLVGGVADARCPATTSATSSAGNINVLAPAACSLGIAKSSYKVGEESSWTVTSNRSGLLYFTGRNGSTTAPLISDTPVLVGSTHQTVTSGTPKTFSLEPFQKDLDVGTFYRDIKIKDSSGNTLCTSANNLLVTVTPAVCTLKLNSSTSTSTLTYRAGDTPHWSILSDPTGKKAFWFGTKNGTADASGTPVGLNSVIGVTPMEYDYLSFTAGDVGLFTRKIQAQDSLGRVMCESNTITFKVDPAAPKIVGAIEGVQVSGQNVFLNGWACDQGDNRSVSVQLYADGAAGTGFLVGTYPANLASDATIATKCLNTGTAHRFSIQLNKLASVATRLGKKLYVHGVSLNAGTNNALANSGIYAIPRFPTPLLIGSNSKPQVTTVVQGTPLRVQCDYGQTLPCANAFHNGKVCTTYIGTSGTAEVSECSTVDSPVGPAVSNGCRLFAPTAFGLPDDARCPAMTEPITSIATVAVTSPPGGTCGMTIGRSPATYSEGEVPSFTIQTSVSGLVPYFYGKNGTTSITPVKVSETSPALAGAAYLASTVANQSYAFSLEEYAPGSAGSYTRGIQFKRADGSVACSTPEIPMTILAATCSLAVNPVGSVKVGQTATWSGSSSPAGKRPYWIGTRNGSPDPLANGSQQVTSSAGTPLLTPFSVTVGPFAESDVAAYVRQIIVKNDKGQELCRSAPLSFTVKSASTPSNTPPTHKLMKEYFLLGPEVLGEVTYPGVGETGIEQ